MPFILYNKISELTREDMNKNRAKINEFDKQELWAKTDKNDTDIKSSGLNVSYLPQDGNFMSNGFWTDVRQCLRCAMLS